jgi:hypothetical protein
MNNYINEYINFIFIFIIEKKIKFLIIQIILL